MRSADISGISPNFLELSQSRGQVAHVLLTRSPLEHPPEGGVSFDLHVLSTPPAFVLSQDQTLRRCLNPGENQELTLLISINPKKPTKGLLLGTDFRHAVEFSRSGRATTRPFRVSSLATFPTVRRSRGCSPGGFSAAPGGLGGATGTKVHDPSGLCTGGRRGRWPPIGTSRLRRPRTAGTAHSPG